MALLKKISAFVLASALVLSSIPFSASAAGVISSDTKRIAPGLDLTVSQYQNSGGSKNEERYIVSTPGSGAVPVVAYGSTLYGTSTVKYVASHETSRGNEVIAGINGDFYMTDTGVPIGIVITDGILRSSDAGVNAVGMYSDGSVIIGTPALSITAVADSGASVKIDYVNKTRKNYGVWLLTDDFSANTRATGESVMVVLGGLSGELRVGGYVNAQVVDIITTSTTREIGADEMIITATVENGNSERLSGFVVGDNVQITVTSPDERWSEVSYAVGAGDMLVSDSAVCSGLSTSKNPRTAVGVRADGSAVFYTVDGRSASWSAGMGLDELANRMLELGCVSAVNMDGGGSTAMVAAMPGKTELDTQNRPSDGTLRMGANYILFLNKSESTGMAEQFFFYPETVTLLAGTSYTPNCYPTDRNYHPVTLPQDVEWSVSGQGSVDASGRYTAPEGFTGVDVITVSNGAYSGSMQVNVISSPDNIYVTSGDEKITELRLEPSQSISLGAYCEYAGEEIESASTLYKWNVSGGIGSMSSDGKFTATAENGVRGTITVSYGSATATVNVTVGKGSTLIDGFENGNSGISGSATGITSSVQPERAYVKYGESSAKIVTNFGADSSKASLATNWKIPAGSLTLKMWVYGDNSQNELGVTVAMDDGSQRYIKVCALNYKEYALQTVELPDGAVSVSSVDITRTASGRSTGTIYIDQVTASYSSGADTTPPVISAVKVDSVTTPGSAVLTAAFSDDESAVLAENIAIMFDGVKIGFSYDSASSTLISTPIDPSDGKLHRITIEASDAAGNVSRYTYTYDLRQGTEQSPFADAAGESSIYAANYLNARGVLNGSLANDGKLYYYPQKTMTRMEFAVLMANYLKVDLSEYSEVELPFTDAASIDNWAQDAVKAMYALGIISGKAKNDGTLIFDPRATMTRADVCTVLGRTLPGGYQSADLKFDDASSIPSYAKEFVGVLVTIGALQNSGSFRPTDSITRSEAALLVYGMY